MATSRSPWTLSRRCWPRLRRNSAGHLRPCRGGRWGAPRACGGSPAVEVHRTPSTAAPGGHPHLQRLGRDSQDSYYRRPPSPTPVPACSGNATGRAGGRPLRRLPYRTTVTVAAPRRALRARSTPPQHTWPARRPRPHRLFQSCREVSSLFSVRGPLPAPTSLNCRRARGWPRSLRGGAERHIVLSARQVPGEASAEDRLPLGEWRVQGRRPPSTWTESACRAPFSRRPGEAVATSWSLAGRVP